MAVERMRGFVGFYPEQSRPITTAWLAALLMNHKHLDNMYNGNNATEDLQWLSFIKHL